jgi:hypothetical protein
MQGANEYANCLTARYKGEIPEYLEPRYAEDNLVLINLRPNFIVNLSQPTFLKTRFIKWLQSCMIIEVYDRLSDFVRI